MIKAEREGAEVFRSEGEELFEFRFKPNRIAAAMILGDNYKRKDVKRTVSSLQSAGIDKLFIAYNGKTRRSLQWLFFHLKRVKLHFLIQKFPWEDDFAKARNQSFALIPKDEFDWILWIDSDDVLVMERPFAEIFKDIDPYTQGIYLRYDYAVDEETGAIQVQQWRERILSTSVNWEWKYPVHEVATAPVGTKYEKADGAYIRHIRSADHDPVTRERNRRIISKALRDNPDDQRMQFYFGNELLAEADLATNEFDRKKAANAAILAYKKFLANSEARPDDMYLAATRMGELYIMKGEPEEALDTFLDCLKIYPSWPDAYIGMARAAMMSKDWQRCKDFAEIAIQLPIPRTASGITPVTYEYTPLLLRGLANENLDLFEKAKEDYEAAAKIWNPDEGILRKKLSEIDAKIAAKNSSKDDRKLLRGTSPNKSIAFLTAPLAENWHPDLEAKGGAGGAETCIMRLAPRFAADGWRVAVFGTPGVEHRGVDGDGVEWWDAMEYVPNEKFKIVISSRVPEFLAADIYCDHKILWMHDVNVGPRLIPYKDFPSVIVGLTDWHVAHMSRLYDIPATRFSVVPNGIELDLYKLDEKPEFDGELRFIWSSSLDRGLGTLIAMWPWIKSRWPESRLDVFYGWNLIDKLIENKDRRAGHLQHIKNVILGNIQVLGGTEAGIYLHGRIPQSTLAKEQLKSHIWPYPTAFMETFCITAVEMQAAGVIPVTSDLAALSEVVASKDLLIKGWPLNRDYQTRWLTTLTNVVESTPERQIELQTTGRTHAEQFTWDSAYAKWNDLFRSLDGRK